MATRNKSWDITISNEGGAFNTLLKKWTSDKGPYDFEGLSALRKLISNEKARILHTIKTKTPASIYQLAKILQRDFKSVSEDVKLLERFGFVDFVEEKEGKRRKLRPIVVVDSINIKINV